MRVLAKLVPDARHNRKMRSGRLVPPRFASGVRREEGSRSGMSQDPENGWPRRGSGPSQPRWGLGLGGRGMPPSGCGEDNAR